MTVASDATIWSITESSMMLQEASFTISTVVLSFLISLKEIVTNILQTSYKFP
jgi:hypothetical protein